MPTAKRLLVTVNPRLMSEVVVDLQSVDNCPSLLSTTLPLVPIMVPT